MIKLFQFAPAFGLPNASPFCMKLETYLRMAGLPFELVNSGDVMKAPNHKLPYIHHDPRLPHPQGDGSDVRGGQAESRLTRWTTC